MFEYGRRIARELENLLGAVDHPVARALIAPRRLPAVADGAWTRRDHRKVLVVGAAAFLIGWTIALGFFSLTDRQPSATRTNTLLTGVGLFVALGGSYLGWKGLQHLRDCFRGPAGK